MARPPVQPAVSPGAPEPGDPDDRPTLVDAGAVAALLAEGELELIGRLVASSNNALVGTVRGRLSVEPVGGAGPQGEATPRTEGEAAPGTRVEAGPETAARPRAADLEVAVACVYKPIRGERPLWDFPDGTLAGREVAAYALSEAAGWDLVPPTVLRDGPFGPGMLQLWVEADETVDRVALVVEGDARLRPMALFDVVANNADRKVGHVLPTADGRLYGVDHGICFHVEPKLRTVLWRWQDEPLEREEVATLTALQTSLGGPLGDRLAALITPDEVRATAERLGALLHEGRFPRPDPDRPAIPWPPY
jgi:uncharacterized repeat protein (TIGR03843 family)